MAEQALDPPPLQDSVFGFDYRNGKTSARSKQQIKARNVDCTSYSTSSAAKIQ
jgi:hypothetical protein